MSVLTEHHPLTAGGSSITKLLETARLAALKAGEAILEIYRTGDVEVALKPDDSPLTRADRSAHTIISNLLEPTGLPILSEEGLHSPYQERAQWEWYWLLDPLDGTKEFINRNGDFTVNIALMYKTTPVAGVVYAPTLGTLYFGSKKTGVYKEQAGKRTQLEPLPERTSFDALQQKSGIKIIASRSHMTEETEQFIARFSNVQLVSMGSSLKFMLLAEGKADLYPRFAPTMEWDTAAAHAILRAVNRSIYQADLETELIYNKPQLLNPSFVAF
ncbi:3'(2'),5'-bisphosphate nucleotidase CysQ [Pontibacter ruber]|uniref:3'(2'),5'-bisphosphate nucleotidase CysQ n=1 Tax=Pontibacter ruber TaxID=1343895 RepID=A0ABW5D020_9BACT|nr:3'(2'),5'-bisphosphate nucleotidase CysQ [Pontibacter ruber]